MQRFTRANIKTLMEMLSAEASLYWLQGCKSLNVNKDEDEISWSIRSDQSWSWGQPVIPKILFLLVTDLMRFDVVALKMYHADVLITCIVCVCVREIVPSVMQNSWFSTWRLQNSYPLPYTQPWSESNRANSTHPLPSNKVCPCFLSLKVFHLSIKQNKRHIVIQGSWQQC